MADTDSATNPIELATELTIAWLANPNSRVSPEDVPTFLQSMHNAVTGLTAATNSSEQEASSQEQFTPAVSVRKSLAFSDHIISMIDGKPYKSLKRHLSSHGLTPSQYRERYGLKPDYPMVSEGYSQVRRDMAKKIGLGRKPSAAPADEAESGKKVRKPRATKAAPAPAEGEAQS